MTLLAALPMYDWPEARLEVDAQWARLCERLRAGGLDAPDALTRDADLPTLWRDPNLILAQTCWGPLEEGLADHVAVVGQPDYSDVEGGAGPLYSSAILMRKGAAPGPQPAGDAAILPLHLFRNRRFAFNSTDSMSGLVALFRDLQAAGESLAIFSDRIETGGHRLSIRAVAEGQADLCAVDCRSWALAQRHDPEISAELVVVGWTAKRLGLPFIMAKALVHHRGLVRATLQETGMLAEQAPA